MSDVTATNLPLDDGAGAALVAALVLALRAHYVFPESSCGATVAGTPTWARSSPATSSARSRST